MSLVQVMRRKGFQPFWQLLHRASLIGMNYWSSEFGVTGERDALAYVARQLARVVRPVVFDVGANIGDYSLGCLQAFRGQCRIHAFEPAKATFDRLASVPEFPMETVSLHCLAFSDRDGQAILHSSEPGSSIASLEELERPVRPFDKSLDEEVHVTTIDRFCDDHGIEEIDLLKLDIEGHELSALRGARRMLNKGRIRFLQFEFGENNISSGTYLSDFHKLLADQYRMFRIVPGGLIPWRYEGGPTEIFATMNYLCERKSERNQ